VAIVRDIMNQQSDAVRSDSTLTQAVEFLKARHLGTAPVVSSAGDVVGIISESDLIDVLFKPSAKYEPVSEYMNTEVQVVHPDDPLSRPAELFALYFFRLLPVVEAGKLIGTVTCRELIQYALRTGEVLTDPLTELIPALAPIT
jgi:CBS domain-containing protein